MESITCSITNKEEAVRKAIEELAPELKGAYLQALEKCPSDITPERFLRHEKGNVGLASKLMARNWSFRVQLFGIERAFLPLNDLSGKGALSELDLKVFSTGFLSLLPNDDEGRAVAFFNADETAIPELSTQELMQARFRGFFYMLTTVSARSTEFVMFRYSDSPKLEKERTGMLSLFLQTFPIQLHAFHTLYLPPNKAAMRMYKDTLIPLHKQYLGEYISKVLHCHICESPNEMLDTLLRLGLSKSALPLCAGGCGTYHDYTRWTANFDRTAIEQERKERKRKMDIVYSRERRQKEKGKVDELKIQADQLKYKNALAKQEAARLRDLVKQCELVVVAATATTAGEIQPQQLAAQQLAVKQPSSLSAALAFLQAKPSQYAPLQPSRLSPSPPASLFANPGLASTQAPLFSLLRESRDSNLGYAAALGLQQQQPHASLQLGDQPVASFLMSSLQAKNHAALTPDLVAFQLQQQQQQDVLGRLLGSHQPDSTYPNYLVQAQKNRSLFDALAALQQPNRFGASL
jgi:hypothetical protein